MAPLLRHSVAGPWLTLLLSGFGPGSFGPRRGAGAPTKEGIAHVQCKVCEMAMKEARDYATENNIKDDDSLSDMIDGLCSVKKKEGKWVSMLDITREDDGAPLELTKKGMIGYCKSECLTVQRACTASL